MLKNPDWIALEDLVSYRIRDLREKTIISANDHALGYLSKTQGSSEHDGFRHFDYQKQQLFYNIVALGTALNCGTRDLGLPSTTRLRAFPLMAS